MTAFLSILNAGAVGLFGTILSAAFCDIKWTKRAKMIFVGVITALALLQAVLFIWTDTGTVRKLYPLITHLPLILLLGFLSRKWVWSVISVLTAYLCCQLRRWLALFFVALLSGSEDLQVILEIIVTLPLLFVLLRFAAPAVRSMSHYPPAMRIFFGLIPAVGYLFDYLTRIYTDWLIRGVPAAVEFMPFVCSVGYLAFALYSAKTVRRQSELEQTQTVLDLQIKQSARQIEEMKKSQELTSAYRHDLRHHLQYLSACIESGALEQAQEYIHSLHNEITKQVVTQYCENRAVNLILSAFAGRAAETGVAMSVHVQLGELLRISDSDLSVFLSNALENALNACQKNKGTIEVRGYTRENRIFLEVINPCDGPVLFENGLPVTRKKGHGIGVRSICAVTEKYGGLYLFEVQDGRFVLRLSL